MVMDDERQTTMAMDGGQMTAMRCTVVGSRRCEAPDDGPHSRVAHAGGRWWRWLPVGAWVLSARVTPWPRAALPTLLELAAGAR